MTLTQHVVAVRFTSIVATLAFALLLALPEQSSAQVEIRPSIGIHAINFVGSPPVAQPISPGFDRNLPLGGGMTGAQNGARLQLDILPEPKSTIRFPIAFEAYSLVGKTTFSLGRITPGARIQRLTFTHDATILSGSLGITASFFDLPSLYVGVEGKANYILPTTVTTRAYYIDNGETISERSGEPAQEKLRYGAFFRVGTQVEFFEPLLLDFNLGLGVLNLIGKDKDAATQQNLLVVDRDRHDPEESISYFGIGMSVVWKL